MAASSGSEEAAGLSAGASRGGRGISFKCRAQNRLSGLDSAKRAGNGRGREMEQVGTSSAAEHPWTIHLNLSGLQFLHLQNGAMAQGGGFLNCEKRHRCLSDEISR